MAASYTHRDRVIAAINHEKLDRLPIQINYTKRMGELLARHFGVQVTELPFFLGNHIMTAVPDERIRIDHDALVEYDIFGVGWDLRSEGFLVAYHPLNNLSDYDTYRFPDPDDPSLLNSAAKLIQTYRGKYFINGAQGFCLFERAWTLRGFTNFLTDLVVNQDFVEELLDRITDFQVRLARHFVELGVDGGHTGDDFGQQKGLIISPAMWRRFIKPRLAKVWSVYKDAGLYVTHHSCGDVREILDDMIEIGLNVLNPVQPQAMPIEGLAKRYGKQLAFYGGISTQHTLPFGTTEDVRAEVANAIATLGATGGYIVSPSHEMTSDIPMENVDAMLNTIRELA